MSMSVALFLAIALVGWSGLEAAEVCASHSSHWVIVMDAGSTKTKMNMYEFRLGGADSSKWIPVSYQSKEAKPALSQFNPFKASDSLALLSSFKELFRFAESIITCPKSRQQTPVFLYATAGLRDLHRSTANKLLRLVRIAFARSVFDRSFPKSEMPRVRIITGRDEGRFAWLSVNYLASVNFANQTSKKDFGLIDMGGGSTQIAFRPYDFDEMDEAGLNISSLWYPGRLTNATGPGVYSKSFADYGLSAITMKYAGAYEDCHPSRKCPGGKNYSTPCLHPDYRSTFRLGPYEFPISGEALENGADRYQVCLDKGRELLKKYGALPGNDMAPIQFLLSHDRSLFFGIAGYYYTAKQIAQATNVTLPSADAQGRSGRCQGYQMTLSRLEQGVRQLCANVPNSNDPFMPYSCMRGAYLVALLQDGYKFKRDSTFHMCKTLPVGDGGSSTRTIEVGWPLGVAQLAAETILEKHS